MAIPPHGVELAISSALARLTGAQSGSKKTDMEFIHASTPSWPLNLPNRSTLTPAEWRKGERRPIRISVLDSSFNPPTKAHLALATSAPPPSRSIPWTRRVSGETHDAQSSGTAAVEVMHQKASEMRTYDAHMLLLSVTNADKKLKQGDATYQQRLGMMVLLAQDIERSSVDASSFNLCVAAIDEPTFVGKSRKLKRAVARKLASLPYYKDQSSSDSRMDSMEESTSTEWGKEINLFFVLGFDTVTRLFDPRFYGSTEAMKESLRSFFAPCAEGGDGSYVVCARRQFPGGGGKSSRDDGRDDQGQSRSLTLEMNDEELQFFTSPAVKDYFENGRVTLMEDLHLDLQATSSTLARKARSAPSLVPDLEIRRLLPESVANYVFDQGLYSGLEA